MHIGVLCDPASFHTQKWAQGLQRNGAKVTVFSFSDEKVEGVPCVKVEPVGGKLNYAAFLRSGKRLKEALLAHKVDVLNPINITPYGVWAARSGFRPIAAVSMGADILEYPPSRKHAPNVAWMQTEPPGILGKLANRLRHRYFRKLVKEALDAASLVTGDNLVLVHSVRDWFDIPEERLQLNRWGVEPALFEVDEEIKSSLRAQFGIEEGQAVVLSPRGMKPIYQGEIILEAFGSMLEEGRKEKFIMFSAGYAISKAVQERADALTAKYPNFHYEGGVLPRERVLQLWSLVDAFISAPVYDGHSNALAEGRYASAVPLVNPIPGNLEVVEPDVHGVLVDPFTADNLSKKLRSTLNELDALKEAFGPVNRQWIEENSVMDANMQRFLERVEEITL